MSTLVADRPLLALERKQERLDRKRPHKVAAWLYIYIYISVENGGGQLMSDEVGVNDRFAALQKATAAVVDESKRLSVEERAEFEKQVADRRLEQADKIESLRELCDVRIAKLLRERQEEKQLVGTKNQRGCARFSEDEVNEIIEELDTLTLDASGPASGSAPLAPTREEQAWLEDVHCSLLPQDPVGNTNPWWLDRVCLNRDLWYGTAVFDGDAGTDTIYVFLLAKMQPNCAYFLEARVRAEYWPELGGGLGGVDRLNFPEART